MQVTDVENGFVVAKVDGGRRGANYATQNSKQKGLTVWHRELYSISCDKPSWKRM